LHPRGDDRAVRQWRRRARPGGPEEARAEIVACLDFAFDVYRVFGFPKYRVDLSVRGSDSGKHYLGRDEDWEHAEGALGRLRRLATMQLDFNLPDRFGLEYVGPDNASHRRRMIHGALFGSVERFFGVLVEHYAGAFPVWLAPVQVAVLMIIDRVIPYAEQVARALREAGLRVELNGRGDKIGAKIRDAQRQKIPFMLGLGDREAEQGTVERMALRLVRSRAVTAE
jgi:threonyl-tRNA synthetase